MATTSSRQDLQNVSLGKLIQTVVRIRPNTSFTREDLKYSHDRIGIVDVNQRVKEEYSCKDIYDGDVPLHAIVDRVFEPYFRGIVNGVNIAVLGFGATGAGKTFNIEGEGTSPGLISYFVKALFQMLDDKKYKLNAGRAPSVQSQGYNYSVKIRYVEIADEVVSDLLVQATSRSAGTLNVLYDEWEGPTISSATWLPTNNASHLLDMFALAKKNRTVYANEFGPLHERAASVLTLEVLQVGNMGPGKSNVQVSRAFFVDMPGAEKLQGDAEVVRIKEGTSLNRGIMSFAEIVKKMADGQSDYVNYRASQLTSLFEDILGGNCMTMAFVCLQQGDSVNSSLVLSYMKHLGEIMNYPVENNDCTLGLLRKYRLEILHLLDQVSLSSPDHVDGYNVKVTDLEHQVLESNLDKLRFADERATVIERMKELRENFNDLVREKAELQGDLIRSEEERLQVSRALVELQIENEELKQGRQDGSYEVNSKLLHAENEVLAAKRDQQAAMDAINDMQEKLRTALEEKRELEIEFVALKTNYLTQQDELQEELKKNEELGIENINLLNAYKAVTGDTQFLSKKKDDLANEQSRLSTTVEKLRKENRDLSEALMNARKEVEQQKSEVVKNELVAQKAQLDFENKKSELERVYIEMGWKRESEVKAKLEQAESKVRKLRDKTELGDADFVTMNRQLKAAQRKIKELEEHLQEYMKKDEEVAGENRKLNLAMEEMRLDFRSRLLRALGEGSKLEDGVTKMAREELIRSYTEKEIELNDKYNNEVQRNEQLMKMMRALRTYARSLKNLAEDWAPLGQPMPEVLTLPPPLLVDEEDQTLASKAQRDEVERLRMKNSRLEQELKHLQVQMIASTEQYTRVIQAQKDPSLQRRLVSELEQLKTQPVSVSRPGSGQYDMDVLRKERNQLREENKRLMQEVRDLRLQVGARPAPNAAPKPSTPAGSSHTAALLEENERLKHRLRELESLPVGSGNTRLLQQKIAYLEEVLKKLERERSELSVRATMAEEQLKNLHESMNTTVQGYQKKISELKRALGRGGGGYDES